MLVSVAFDDEIIEDGMELFDYLMIKKDDIVNMVGELVTMLYHKKSLYFVKKENDLALYFEYKDINDEQFENYIKKFNKLIFYIIDNKEFKYRLREAGDVFIEYLMKFLNDENRNKIMNILDW